MIFDYSIEYNWQQFKNFNNIKKLPLQEQIKHYNKYLTDLSIQRNLVESAYQNANTFQSFQGISATGAGAGGNPVTASFYSVAFVSTSNSASACYSASVFPTTIYYMPSASLQLGHILYSTSNFTQTASAGYYSNGNVWYYVGTNGALVSLSGSCSSLSSPIALGYDPNFNAGTGSACTSASVYSIFNQNYYLNSDSCTSINIGCRLYTNSSLVTVAPIGSYSDGTKWYRIQTSGIIHSSGSCA